MASWGHTLGRKNVFSTWLYTWRVYDGLAACGVIYTAMPEVGWSFVKMRNTWLPTAIGEKPPFLKKYHQEYLSSRDLVGRRALFWYKLSAFPLKYTGAILKCPLLWWRSGAPRTPAPGGTEPPLSEAQLCLFSHTGRNGGLLHCSPLKTVILVSGPCQWGGCESGGQGGPEAKFP